MYSTVLQGRSHSLCLYLSNSPVPRPLPYAGHGILTLRGAGQMVEGGGGAEQKEEEEEEIPKTE